MNRIIVCGALISLSGLVGCGSSTLEPGEMRITASSGSAFSGVAGTAWAEGEIRNNAGRDSCGGELPASFAVTKTEAGQEFSGTC